MKNSNSTFWATLTGLASGIAIGILVAPDKGTRTRKKITQQGDNYLNDIKNELSEIRKDVNKKIEATKEGMEDLTSKGKKRAKEAGDEVQESMQDT